ncbi:MAG TPA: 5'-nucleotidase C-terminal domain-containing protein [Sphingobacteriaceae bacterium]
MSYSIQSRLSISFGLLSLTFLGLVACSPQLHVAEITGAQYVISKELPRDSTITAFLAPYKANIDSQMSSVIATAGRKIERRKPEGLLNNLVTDAMADIARQNNIGFDLAHTNYEGLRNPLPEGPIRTYKVFELMPFESYLVVVKLDGKGTQELFDYMAALGGDPISGASFKIKGDKAVDVLIGGKPLDPSRTYTVLTSDYMANGGDMATFYPKALERKDTQIKLRDAILMYLKQQTEAGKTINPQIDGRITVE